ncbi:hypothetical protein Tco_1195979 [Tanacetum coccineum]
MKDLGSAKQILGMSIIRDRTKHTLRLSQEKQEPLGDYLMYAMEAVKWLLCYLKGTSKATLYFRRKEVVLEGFSDLDYGGCLDTGKSTIEAEYMAIAEAGKELVWLKNFLEELDRAQTECVMYCDNQSAIHLVNNLVFHSRTKHINIRYRYIRKLVSEGTLYLKKILGAKNPADMLTKVVTTEK